VNDSSRCSAIPACSAQTPLRCKDGCYPLNTTCTRMSSAKSCPRVTCPIGTCVDYLEECPLFNGCDPDTPIQCANGLCTNNDSDCFCSGTSNMKCFDGSCVPLATDCPPVPYQIKPIPFAYSLDPTSPNDLTITIVSEDNNTLCTLNIPSGTFDATQHLEISIAPKADSQLYETNYFNFYEYSLAIYSSVIDLTLSPEVPMPFKKMIAIECSIILPNTVDKNKLCLASVDGENSTWTCGKSRSKVKEDSGVLYFSGETNHFTSFAVLLGNDTLTSSGSNSYEIIIGVVGSFVVVVIISIIVIEIYRRREKKKELQDMELSRTQSSIDK